MKKKELRRDYQKPSMLVVELKHGGCLLAGSPNGGFENPTPERW